MGLCRFIENSLGPHPLRAFILVDSVHHRLLVELCFVAFPVVSIWGLVKDLMASHEAEWPLVLSEDLHRAYLRRRGKMRRHHLMRGLLYLARLGYLRFLGTGSHCLILVKWIVMI